MLIIKDISKNNILNMNSSMTSEKKRFLKMVRKNNRSVYISKK